MFRYKALCTCLIDECQNMTISEFIENQTSDTCGPKAVQINDYDAPQENLVSATSSIPPFLRTQEGYSDYLEVRQNVERVPGYQRN